MFLVPLYALVVIYQNFVGFKTFIEDTTAEIEAIADLHVAII